MADKFWIRIGRYPEDERYMSSGVGISPNRPHYGGGWTLCDEPHQWFVDRNISYDLIWNPIGRRPYPDLDPNCWFVGIANKDQAMMFKLTWGI